MNNLTHGRYNEPGANGKDIYEHNQKVKNHIRNLKKNTKNNAEVKTEERSKSMQFEIRNSQMEDLAELQTLFRYAREQMKKNGNPTQWGDSRPATELIVGDIENKTGYVLTVNAEICGAFALILGEDPTYAEIEDGSWLNDEPYGVIHRVASNGKYAGVMAEILRFCENRIGNIRIDTHHDNQIMQHILEKNGYERCGIIYVDDGTPRIAYQKIVL